MESSGKEWWSKRGGARLHWVLLAAACVWVKAASPVMAQGRYPACYPEGRAVCTCSPNKDGLQLDCTRRNPVLDSVPSAMPENTAVL